MALRYGISNQVNFNPAAPYLTAQDYYNQQLLEGKAQAQELANMKSGMQIGNSLASGMAKADSSNADSAIAERQKATFGSPGWGSGSGSGGSVPAGTPGTTSSVPTNMPTAQTQVRPQASSVSDMIGGISGNVMTPTITTLEEYDALPSGSQFTDADGRMRRKP